MNGEKRKWAGSRDSRATVWSILLPAAIMLVAGVIAVALVRTKRKPGRRPPAERSQMVRVRTVHSSTERIRVQATGTVVPARAVALRPRVAGQVVEVSASFVPGGRFRAGAVIMRLDPRDHELAVIRLESDLARAEHDYKVELGRQDIAKREWDLVGGKESASALDRELTLREPHMAKARGARDAARAALEQARLNLARTAVEAPFDAVVLSRAADIGAQVSVQTSVAELVGTDEYWVRVSLPVDHLRWVRVPGPAGEAGAAVRIRPSGGVRLDSQWQGTVIRLLPDLEAQGRLAQLLVSVPDPLKGAVPLLLGSYVRLEIDGPELQDVFALSRRALHDGSNVWLMTAGNRLEIRPVQVVWSGPDRALVGSGLKDGERLIESELAAPVAGMLLEEQAAAGKPAG